MSAPVPGWEALGAGSAVAVVRGGAVESVHGVAACVTDADGRPARQTAAGVASLPVFPRSAAKPLQALPAARAGVVEGLGLGPAHLAVACASHSGGAEPVRLVEELLAAAGLDERVLRCGVLAPLDASTATALVARGEPARPVHHNCSGNHALGLALCVRRGWPVEGYLDAEHPLQAAMRDAVGEATRRPGRPRGTRRVRNARLPGAPCRLATAYGRLASGGLGDAGARVAAAMRAHPHVVWGPDGVDSAIMLAVPGAVAKVGADGVVAVGLPDGRGLALKALDGARRALEPAAVAAMRTGLGAGGHEHCARPARPAGSGHGERRPRGTRRGAPELCGRGVRG